MSKRTKRKTVPHRSKDIKDKDILVRTTEVVPDPRGGSKTAPGDLIRVGKSELPPSIRIKKAKKAKKTMNATSKRPVDLMFIGGMTTGGMALFGAVGLWVAPQWAFNAGIGGALACLLMAISSEARR